jgi:hypothetical protein
MNRRDAPQVLGQPAIDVGAMKRAFVLSQTAVLVFDWYEPDPGGHEHGVRVEVRLLGDSAHRGTASAAQEVVIDRPLFRADLFDLIAGEPGNFTRAHYHSSFEGVEPCEREWDGELSANPFGWLSGQLSDLEAMVAAAGATDSVDRSALGADAATLRELVMEVVAAARGVMAMVRARA